MLSVALCTYNGERYIREQLESIGRQSLPPDEVVISDDGSSDQTVSRIHSFLEESPLPVRVLENSHPAGGVIGNFSRAVGECQGDYIALCDQDDVWLPDKLQRTVTCLKELEARYGPATPLLVHSDLTVTDEALRPLDKSMMASQKLRNEPDMRQAFSVLLVQNYVTGCSVVFNRALKEIACPFPDDIVMHDWWLALLAAAAGQIGFVDAPLLLYRQHGGNQVGARKFLSGANVRRIFSPSELLSSILATIRQARQVKERLPEGYARGLISSYLSFLEREAILPIYRLGIHKQNMMRNAAFYWLLWSHRHFFRKHLSELPKP